MDIRFDQTVDVQPTQAAATMPVTLDEYVESQPSIGPRRDSESTLIDEDNDGSGSCAEFDILRLADNVTDIKLNKHQKDATTYSKKDSIPKPSATVCVIGVGYVGETLVSEFSHFYDVIGFDVNPSRVDVLKTQYSSNPRVYITSKPAALSYGTHFLISVPTLVNPDLSIDTKHILSALALVTTYARPGSTIVIESSVCVGMSRQLLGPYLSTYKCGMSPERVDPGRISPAPYDIPKIVSGMNELSLESIQALYRPVFRQVVPVSSPETAEMTKLFENCFRMVNIAYVNEISDACDSHGIDAKEVMAAAATKPFGFMPFTPGLGVGGHCIPINPHYLKANCSLPILEKSTKRMAARPAKMAKLFLKKARTAMKSSLDLRSRQPRILVVGLAFKPGQSLVANSPALDFLTTLKKLGVKHLCAHDPLVSQKAVPWAKKLNDTEWNVKDLTRNFDAIAVCMKQKGVDLVVLEKVKQPYIKIY